MQCVWRDGCSDGLSLLSATEAMAESTKVTTAIDHCTTTAADAPEDVLTRAGVLVWCVLHPVALA
jgi:hypothetical protein